MLFDVFHESSLNDFGGNTYKELGVAIVPYSPLDRGFLSWNCNIVHRHLFPPGNSTKVTWGQL